MRTDSRLSRMLHVLIHMDQREEPVTSEMIAAMLCTNPVVVRRTMAGLRDQGYVQSGKGRGGGWRLGCSLHDITLLDIYRALGEPAMFTMALAEDDPRCLVEQAVNAAVSDAVSKAQAVLLERFGRTTVGAIARNFNKRLKTIECPR